MGWFKRIMELLRRAFTPTEVCYVNGADVLPPPLSGEEEREAILGARTDPASRSRLIEHNLRLVVFVAKKFDGTGVGIEDLISIGTMGLMKAISTFSLDKNVKLATYASRCIENEILMFLRKTAGQKREVSFDEPLNVDWDGNELLLSDVLGSEADAVCRPIEEREERALVRDSVARLPERERIIIELRYGLRGGREMTQKEVADKLGISQSYISRLEKKIMAELRTAIGDKI